MVIFFTMSKVLSKKSVEIWLQENKPEIELLWWAGQGNKKSKFKNLKYETEFEMKFKVLKGAFKKNPEREFGIPLSLRSKKVADSREKKTGSRGPKTLKKETVEYWLQENRPDIKLVEWSGQSIKKSKFKDTKRDVEFQISFNNLKAMHKRNPNTVFGATKEEKVKQAKKTFQKNWGIDNPNKIKSVRDKIEKTNLKRYGVINPSQNIEIKEKRIKTNLERWGVEYPSQDPGIKAKIVESNLEKWGVEHFFQIEDVRKKCLLALEENKSSIQEKRKKTNKEKYGFEYLHQSEEIKQKAKNTKIKKGLITIIDGKTLKEWAGIESLGCYSSILVGHRDYGIHPRKIKKRRSKLELKIKNYLIDELKLAENKDFLWNKKLPEMLGRPNEGSKRPDFCFLKLKLIIEADGEWYHIRTKEQIEKDESRYRLYKSFGYNVLIFSGSEIKNNWQKVQKKIIENVSEII